MTEEISGGSPCHHAQLMDVDVYLKTTPETVAHPGRKVIGWARMCPAPTGGGKNCHKVYALIRARGAGVYIGDEAWGRMMKVHPEPPYYFVKTANGLMPEGARNAQECAQGVLGYPTPETTPTQAPERTSLQTKAIKDSEFTQEPEEYRED